MQSLSRLLLCFPLVAAVGCGGRSGLLQRSGSADGSLPDLVRPGDRSPPPPGWVAIQAGIFMMGSPPSEPCREAGTTRETQHMVTISSGFWMSSTEVTQQQFQQRRGYNPSKFASCGPSCPVEQVNWHAAAAYCNELSNAEGLPHCYTCSGSFQSVTCQMTPEYSGRINTCPGYRLPTEAEWEYAYRAGTTTAYYNGLGLGGCDNNATASEIGWYLGNADGRTHPVGQKKANRWGLLDMAGNVWEWCNDGYQDDLGGSAATDPQGLASGASKVLRGSSWVDTAGHLRAADRFGYAPGSRNSNIGFRCVRRD